MRLNVSIGFCRRQYRAASRSQDKSEYSLRTITERMEDHQNDRPLLPDENSTYSLRKQLHNAPMDYGIIFRQFSCKRNLGDLFSLWTKQLESAFFSGRLNSLAEKRETSARHLKIWFCNQLFKWPLATRRWSLKYWISW